MKRQIEFEPYQPFFFSGMLISILGLGVWILFQQGWLSSYPMDAHAFLMVMCFLFSYVCGFLMTAIPKMAQADAAKPAEVGFGLVLVWLQVVLVFFAPIRLNFALGFIQIMFLIAFMALRFFNRRANPPQAFVFLPFGLFAGALGCLLLSLPVGLLPFEVLAFAKILLYQAFILNLILGLGTRLIPALTRVQGALDVRAAVPEKFSKFIGLAILLNSSFVIEAFVFNSAGQLLKFAVIAWVAIRGFKILNPRQIVGHLGTGIRASVYCLALGFLLAGLFPSYMIHFLHLSYIGGFALLTFLISTRVVLAHGGYNLSVELRSRQLVWFFALAIGIGVLRAALGFEGQHRFEILWILFVAWGILCALWSYSFVLKLLKITGASAGMGEKS